MGSYNLRFDDGSGEDDTFYLANTHALVAFDDWVEALPAKGYATAKTFARDGLAKGSDKVARQLQRALAEHPPPKRYIRQVAEQIIELTGVGDPDELIFITDE